MNTRSLGKDVSRWWLPSLGIRAANSVFNVVDEENLIVELVVWLRVRDGQRVPWYFVNGISASRAHTHARFLQRDKKREREREENGVRANAA